MLAFLINKFFIEIFSLGVKLHDIGLDNIHGILNWFFFLGSQFDLILSAQQRTLEGTHLHSSFRFKSKQLLSLDLDGIFLFVNTVRLKIQIFCWFLFFPNLGS